MIDPAMDRGGLKDSENAPNSFFPKINRTVFWRLGTDMLLPLNSADYTHSSMAIKGSTLQKKGDYTGIKWRATKGE